MQTAREESSIVIFGETLLKRESAAEQSVCRESAEAIVPPKRTTPVGRAEITAWATTQISEPIAAEPRSTEMYEASTERGKAVQVRIHVTERRS